MLQAIKASSEANTAEQKRVAERKRNILVLINQHLIENGYVEAAERLQHESRGVLSQFTAADNIDLTLVLNEYEAYYEMRFDRKPKLARKVQDGDDAAVKHSKPGRPVDAAKRSASANKEATSTGHGGTNKLPSVTGASTVGSTNPESDLSLGVSGSSISGSTDARGKKVNSSSDDSIIRFEERLLKPPPHYGGDSELRQLANVICREIYQESPNVRFADIIQLDEAKRLLVEAVQLPLRFPHLFTGILRPWRGMHACAMLLLLLPLCCRSPALYCTVHCRDPAARATRHRKDFVRLADSYRLTAISLYKHSFVYHYVAKAVATECSTTFFNISASTLVSKWRGDSEKLVRVLFEVARYHSPSTIFLDEIDSILTSRNGEGGEHEASRRMKTELLIQMDGVKSCSGSSASSSGPSPDQQVFVMAASNLPWDLDIAVLRRLEKRVLVPLPSVGARSAMFEKHLRSRTAVEVAFDPISQLTEGYSGADIELVCRESAMMPVRRLMRRIDDIDVNGKSSALPDPPIGHTANGRVRKVAGVGASSSSLHAVTSSSLPDMEALLRADPVTTEDITAALKTTKPSSDGKIARCDIVACAWNDDTLIHNRSDPPCVISVGTKRGRETSGRYNLQRSDGRGQVLLLLLLSIHSSINVNSHVYAIDGLTFVCYACR